jgi:quercetin dioxygenase-like cupin family protein
MGAHDITRHPVHLGTGATAEVEPEFTGTMDWYEDYVERHAGDGTEGRLVSMHRFTESWDTWEMHPHGSEVVLCTSGAIRLIRERDDGSLSVTKLKAGEYAINDPGTWHTADVDTEAHAVFITAGWDTRHRPR